MNELILILAVSGLTALFWIVLYAYERALDELRRQRSRHPGSSGGTDLHPPRPA